MLLTACRATATFRRDPRPFLLAFAQYSSRAFGKPPCWRTARWLGQRAADICSAAVSPRAAGIAQDLARQYVTWGSSSACSPLSASFSRWSFG